MSDEHGSEVGEVVDGPTLAELAATANRSLAAVELALNTAFDEAVIVGNALIAAQGLVEVGTWESWLDENFNGSVSGAPIYMRIAYYREHPRMVAAKPKGLTEAKLAIQGLPRIGPFAYAPRDLEDRRREAKTLRDQGLSTRQIGKLMGVSQGTANSYLNRGLYNDRQRQRRERDRARREALRREAARKAARVSGGALAEIYAMAERMQDVMAQAQREAVDREARDALSRAGEHYRKMRDEIVRALGVQ